MHLYVRVRTDVSKLCVEVCIVIECLIEEPSQHDVECN